ncbi:PaaI family thioesterase [Pelagovum pacificum]|uniref:PaaI family thioesterase n=1 Tax=Pelagovum pacificum TaxID=2588711 RepID=A0A5C5GEX5_9RHOB|nr:PaaI family thioesterase [Pelagovum pacificum]QQA44736.1 PaaI family thioesterase [Pelagovum pacificum]TNY32156.1 PaaI family thioesterase [Pelagovum pacificum]
MNAWPDNLHPMDPALWEGNYPFQTFLGFRQTGWGHGYARFELDYRDDFANRHGNTHGSIYAALLDTSMGYSGAYTGSARRRAYTMTLSMTLNFMAPAVGPALMAEGRRSGGGRRIFFTEGRMWDGQGTLVATATGSFKIREIVED